MSATCASFDKIRALIANDDWQASDHSLQRLYEKGIVVSELADGIAGSAVVEDYPSYHKGPCVLVLQTISTGPVHALWGLMSGTERPAVLITAYHPDSKRWHTDNRTRR